MAEAVRTLNENFRFRVLEAMLTLMRTLLPVLLGILCGACDTPDLKEICDTGCDEGDEVVEDGPWAPMVLGHRGTGITDDGNPFAENTMLSFQQAMVEGADGVELDVQQTSDGVLVVLHDELLDTGTTCGGCVVASTYKQVSSCEALNAAGEGHAIPTLEEVILGLPDAFINIEIKSPDSCYGAFSTATAYVNSSAEGVVEIVSALGVSERVQISSFDRAAIRVVEDLSPSIHTALVWSTGDMSAVIEDALWAGADTLNGHGLVIYDGVVEPIDEAGFGLWLWGIELANDVTRVSQWEPGALITDHPELVRQTLVDMGLE